MGELPVPQTVVEGSLISVYGSLGSSLGAHYCPLQESYLIAHLVTAAPPPFAAELWA